ncbi:MAG: hypothetical protein M0R77_01190 [Gammaproteobacteria bacterium]|nr:hypothetical protein [Acholeplasmataceae bacterium]MCK9529171.1 hypothetical protein [Gammaproteobacteria bacterium]
MEMVNTDIEIEIFEPEFIYVWKVIDDSNGTELFKLPYLDEETNRSSLYKFLEVEEFDIYSEESTSSPKEFAIVHPITGNTIAYTNILPEEGTVIIDDDGEYGFWEEVYMVIGTSIIPSEHIHQLVSQPHLRDMWSVEGRPLVYVNDFFTEEGREGTETTEIITDFIEATPGIFLPNYESREVLDDNQYLERMFEILHGVNDDIELTRTKELI